MFRCSLCDTVTEPGTKMTRVVTQTRRVQYYQDGVVVGNGVETVKEISVGPCCGGISK